MYRFAGKRIVVTGACGTIGSALIRYLVSDSSKFQVDVIGLDINENGIFYLNTDYRNNIHCRFRVCDIRDRESLMREMKGVDIVFHTAALKHVSICETSPYEAVKTNLIGVQNVIEASLSNNVKTVIFTSSDKAVNPSSYMGATKLLGEGLITAASGIYSQSSTIFATTRFGNVLGSRGSVVPIFHRQIANGKDLTLTHRDMTRFIMSISEAVKLVLDSAILARGGEIFVTKMPVIKILDLAEVMIRELTPVYGLTQGKVQIVEVGINPGEKLYEELMTSSEAQRAIELEKYFVIFPADKENAGDVFHDYHGVLSRQVIGEYTSQNSTILGSKDLSDFLVNHDLLRVLTK